MANDQNAAEVPTDQPRIGLDALEELRDNQPFITFIQNILRQLSPPLVETLDTKVEALETKVEALNIKMEALDKKLDDGVEKISQRLDQMLAHSQENLDPQHHPNITLSPSFQILLGPQNQILNVNQQYPSNSHLTYTPYSQQAHPQVSHLANTFPHLR